MMASLEIHRDIEDDTSETTQWTISLQLRFTPPDGDNSPYEFRVALFGVFRCAMNLPTGLDAEKMVGINGTSVLYGIARDLIQSLTYNAMWGALILPTMSFTDYRDMLPKKEKQRKLTRKSRDFTFLTR
jgi:preprotein translocase subunit SecB